MNADPKPEAESYLSAFWGLVFSGPGHFVLGLACAIGAIANGNDAYGNAGAAARANLFAILAAGIFISAAILATRTRSSNR